MTPAEPEDAQRLEQRRGQGRGGTGDDVLPGEASAPGRTAGGTPPAREQMPSGEEGNYS